MGQLITNDGYWGEKEYLVIVIAIEFFYLKALNENKSYLVLEYRKENKLTEFYVNKLICQFTDDYRSSHNMTQEQLYIANMITNTFKTKNFTEVRQLVPDALLINHLSKIL